MEEVFRDFQEIILPGITHWQHPSWFAYFPANNSPPSVLAELLTAGIGSQCMIWQTSPAAAELEEVVMDWLRQMLGLPEGMAGVIQDTASTAIDPLAAMGDICRRHGVWLHVDAALAGTAAILPEKKWMLEGAGHMDSFVFNPHKWMLTNFDCSAYFVKDPGALIQTFEIHPEYLKNREGQRSEEFP